MFAKIDSEGIKMSKIPFLLLCLSIASCEQTTDSTSSNSLLATTCGSTALMDFIGNDVNYAVTESVFEAFYYDPRYKPSFTQKQYADAGWHGRKSSKGYYDYGDNIELIFVSDQMIF